MYSTPGSALSTNAVLPVIPNTSYNFLVVTTPKLFVTTKSSFSNSPVRLKTSFRFIGLPPNVALFIPDKLVTPN